MAKKEKKQKPKKKLNLLKPIIIGLVVLASVLSLLYYFGFSSKNSKAAPACKTGTKCIIDKQCGTGGYCQKDKNYKRKTFFSELKIGDCACKQIQRDPTQKCATLPVPEPPKGCKYKANEKNPCMTPLLYCDEGKICQTDEICGEGKTCYQPPMPKCEKGKACIQVMPQKICKAVEKKNECPSFMPQKNAPIGCYWQKTTSNALDKNGCIPPPSLICNEGRNCEKDRICGAGKYCFENPAPLMHDCKDCPKITSTKPRWICKKTDKTSTGSAGSGTIQITGATKKTIE